MAKLIHTADLHLSDGEEKQYCFDVLDEIIALAASEKADFLVIAGDLYDRAIPPTEAIELFEGTVRRLVNAGVHVAAITGNHDSDVRVTV